MVCIESGLFSCYENGFCQLISHSFCHSGLLYSYSVTSHCLKKPKGRRAGRSRVFYLKVCYITWFAFYYRNVVKFCSVHLLNTQESHAYKNLEIVVLMCLVKIQGFSHYQVLVYTLIQMGPHRKVWLCKYFRS